MASKTSNRSLYLAAIVACLTAALFGYSVGFIGGVLVLPSFLHHFHLDTLLPHDLAAAQARIVTVWLVCTATRRSGRASFGVQRWPASQWPGRGRGDACVAYVVSMTAFISEISPPSERGMLMSGYQTALQLSALVGFWGAYASHATFLSSSPLQWQLPVAVQLLPGVFLLLGTFLIPETPRALPPGDLELERELGEIREAAEASELLQSEKRGFFSEARKRGVRKRLGVGIGLMIAQNMVGLNALNYYAPVIFMSAGFTSVSSSLFLTGLFGVVKLISAIAFMFVFVRIRGNRFWLKLGSAICGISMLVLAYYVRLMPPPDQAHEAKLTFGGVVSVAMVYIFALFFGLSLGPISWNVCSEIFPLHINAKCCAITTCTQWLFQIVIASITPRLLASVGWATYLVYALCCALSLLWTHLAVPETRGVPLGRPMDALFDAPTDSAATMETADGSGDRDGDDVENETTALLRSRASAERRRSSVVAYT
ncbi:hypothetical protein BJ546DRAFT_1061361 [Cryomyces antarcticus]